MSDIFVVFKYATISVTVIFTPWMRQRAGWICQVILQSIPPVLVLSLKTSGHEKDHYTVVLSAKADRTKLKPFVVYKGKGTRIIKDLQKIQGNVVKFSANGWLNDDLTRTPLLVVCPLVSVF